MTRLVNALRRFSHPLGCHLVVPTSYGNWCLTCQRPAFRVGR